MAGQDWAQKYLAPTKAETVKQPFLIFTSRPHGSSQMGEVLLFLYSKNWLPKQKGEAKQGSVLEILGGK